MSGVAGGSRCGRDVAGRRERDLRGRSGGRAGGGALRPARRVDQQCRGVVAERSYPQPRDRRLGACVPGQRPRCRQRHPRRGPGHAQAVVGVDHPHGLGQRPDRVVARGSVLRDEGGGDPTREGRRRSSTRASRFGSTACARERSVRGSTPSSRRKRSTRSRPSIRSGWERPPTWSAPTRTSRATRPVGRPGRRSSSTAATPRRRRFRCNPT